MPTCCYLQWQLSYLTWNVGSSYPNHSTVMMQPISSTQKISKHVHTNVLPSVVILCLQVKCHQLRFNTNIHIYVLYQYTIYVLHFKIDIQWFAICNSYIYNITFDHNNIMSHIIFQSTNNICVSIIICNMIMPSTFLPSTLCYM